MKLTENFIKKDSSYKVYSWGSNTYELKHKYESEHNTKVKTYTMSKNELEEYLKKFDK